MKFMYKIIAIVVSIASLGTGLVSAQSVSSNESLNISIKGVPQTEQGRVSGVYNVSPKGYLSMPMLKKDVKASGLSASKLAHNLEDAYKAAGIYKDPRITILSIADNNKLIAREREVVSIGGYVKSPGQRAYINGMTLFQAVSAAGGETAFGSIRRVELYHKGRKAIYDMRKAEHMRVRVYPGDSINIPQKNWKGG
jgi:protein involved in polysaccharide export with SLBB domain